MNTIMSVVKRHPLVTCFAQTDARSWWSALLAPYNSSRSAPTCSADRPALCGRLVRRGGLPASDRPVAARAALVYAGDTPARGERYYLDTATSRAVTGCPLSVGHKPPARGVPYLRIERTLYLATRDVATTRVYLRTLTERCYSIAKTATALRTPRLQLWRQVWGRS